jgi:arylsulfatase A-like enzyme
LDTAVGTLVEDLKASGDFDQTLIVMLGEFGRTPGALNSRGGRDHHRDAMSVAMMGGGVRGGKVIGATDANGGNIVDPGWSRQRPIYMEDIAATLYTALGINWTKSIKDTPSGRKLEYVPYSEDDAYGPVEEVFV